MTNKPKSIHHKFKPRILRLIGRPPQSLENQCGVMIDGHTSTLYDPVYCDQPRSEHAEALSPWRQALEYVGLLIYLSQFKRGFVHGFILGVVSGMALGLIAVLRGLE